MSVDGVSYNRTDCEYRDKTRLDMEVGGDAYCLSHDGNVKVVSCADVVLTYCSFQGVPCLK